MKNQETREDKVDPADAVDTREKTLPGQIPVKDAEQDEIRRRQERQPNVVDAEKAVNPDLRERGGK
jgi:hypothetical protein